MDAIGGRIGHLVELGERALALLERAVVAMERTADAQREMALEMDKHNALYLLSERAKQEDSRG